MARNCEVAYQPRDSGSIPCGFGSVAVGRVPAAPQHGHDGRQRHAAYAFTYLRGVAHAACNKRKPGSGNAAMDGGTRMHAVLGTNAACTAANPSDMNVALAALDAVVHVRSATGPRQIPFLDFHVPGATPDVETKLAPGELLTYVFLPKSAFAKTSRHVKVRDRASYPFALTSCAAALTLEGDAMKEARIAMGGFATKP